MKLTKTDSYFPVYVLQTVPTDSSYYEVNGMLIRHENGKNVPFYAIDTNTNENYWRELKNAEEVIETYPDRSSVEWGSIRDKSNPLNQIIRCYEGYAEVEHLHRTREADEDDMPNETGEIMLYACLIPSPMPGEAHLIIQAYCPDTWEEECTCLYKENLSMYGKSIEDLDNLVWEIADDMVACIIREHDRIENSCREEASKTLKESWQVV